MLNEEHFDGFDVVWPELCKKCSHLTCMGKPKDISSCPRGINFIWLTNNLMIGGIIIKERTSTPRQVASTIKKIPKNNIVSIEKLNTSIRNIIGIQNNYSNLCRETVNRIVSEHESNLIKSKDFKKSIEEKIDKYLETMHDYKQFVSTIFQNINCIIKKYNGKTDEENVALATHYEKAIYYSCIMMESKIKTHSYVKNIHLVSDCDFGKTSIHQLIVKIIRIYQSSFDQKSIKITVGESYANVYTHYNVVTVIPHAIIDNALKYCPEKSYLHVHFKENKESIDVEFESLGPKIDKDERARIFLPATRGKNAPSVVEEGMGFGLYAARELIYKLGGSIDVHQNEEEDANFCGFYKTIFTMQLPLSK
ncbi:MAG: ATP-binding protein [Desulfovibrio sp.]|uniref:sensor histidine kinase n=1 Tax=Desulfovibrio sp. TaxID=885 RepID=UPI00258F12B3|nr:ATP-binding protein [Desulfovibrio sp.]MCD7984837.1 ATP-binding protein [Desulfovibrio sp.]